MTALALRDHNRLRCAEAHVRVGSKAEVCQLARHVRSALRSRHRHATRSGPVRAIHDILHRSIQHVIRSSGRRWHRGPYPRPIAEVSSGSAINITSKVIDHGHRPRPHRRYCSCLIISRASRRDAHLESFDWAAMERLLTKGLISDPVGKAKSVVFTDEGLRQSEASFRKLFTVERESMRRVRIRPDCRASSATGDPAAISPLNAMNSRFIDHLVRERSFIHPAARPPHHTKGY
jgi:hypothetical protein